MQNIALNRLLMQQKQSKFTASVNEGNWELLFALLCENPFELGTAIQMLQSNGKLMDFINYFTDIEWSNETGKMFFQCIGELPDGDLTPAFRSLEGVVVNKLMPLQELTNFMAKSMQQKPHPSILTFLLHLQSMSPNYTPTIQKSVIKFFPHTHTPVELQISYLTMVLGLIDASESMFFPVLSKEIQLLLALDGLLIIDDSVFDDDVAHGIAEHMGVLFQFLAKHPQPMAYMLQLFDTFLLEVPRLVVLQFLFFYVATLSYSNSDDFCGFLLHKIIDSNSPARLRANASFYLSSFLVRCSSLDSSFTETVTKYMLDFAFNYYNTLKANNPAQLYPSLSTHYLYYSVIQAVLYVYCWEYQRWGSHDCKTLSLVINNELQGYRMVDQDVLDVFRGLGIIDLPPNTACIESVTSWFPFDPCPLDELAQYFKSIYRNWSDAEASANPSMILDSSIHRISSKHGISLSDLLDSLPEDI